jgi:ribosomal protein L44E
MEPGFKFCSHPLHDGERKLPVSAFNKKVSARDGLQSRCRGCQNELETARVRAQYGHDDVHLTPEQQRVSREARKVSRVVEPPQDEDDGLDEADDPNAWEKARYWRWLVFRRYAAEASGAGRVGAGVHAVDEVEIERWTNEVLAQYAECSVTRAARVAELAEKLTGSPGPDGEPLTARHAKLLAQRRTARADLDVALSLANEEGPDGAEDLPAGMQPAPQKPKLRLVRMEPVVVEAMDRPVTKRGFEPGVSKLWSRVKEQFHPTELRIAKAKDDGDPTSLEGLALETGKVTETEVAAFSPETHHKDVEARLGRKARALEPRKVQRKAPLPQAYCSICKVWGFHSRVQCPKRSAMIRSAEGRRTYPRAQVGDTFGELRVVALLDTDYTSNERVRVSCPNGHERENYVFNLRKSSGACRACGRAAEADRICEAARDLGRLGGLKGGPARAASLSPERRSEISRAGAEARWGKRPQNGSPSAAPSASEPEKTSADSPEPQKASRNIPGIIPGALDELVLAELSRRACAQVYDLQDVVDVEGDELRSALERLERLGRVRRTGGGRMVLWQAVKS